MKISTSWAQSIIRTLFMPDDPKQLVDAIADELSVGVILEVERREWASVKNENFHFARRIQALVAAQFSAVGVRLTNDQEMVSVVFFVKNEGAAAVDIVLGDSVDAVPNGHNGEAQVAQPFDSGLMRRTAAGPLAHGGATRVFSAASALGVNNANFVNMEALAAGERISKDSHGFVAVLRPGGFLAIQSQVVNQTVQGSFWVYERPAQKGRYFR